MAKRGRDIGEAKARLPSGDQALNFRSMSL